jgi:hypothetical protein
MPTESAYTIAKRLDGDVGRILSRIDLREQDTKVRSSVHTLKRELAELCGEVRDYELADTLAEQQKLGQSARQRLLEIEKYILALSQHDIFDALEIAELSVRMDTLQQELV